MHFFRGFPWIFDDLLDVYGTFLELSAVYSIFGLDCSLSFSDDVSFLAFLSSGFLIGSPLGVF